MSGFFSKKETQLSSRPDGKTYSCISCGLFKGGCSTPKMQPTGNFKLGILNVFETPTYVDDNIGELLSDNYGEVLRKMFQFRALPIDIDKDCLNTSAIKCRVVTDDIKKAKKKENYQIACCRILLKRLIKERKPKLIIAHGKNALFALIGDRWKQDFNDIDQWRGFVIPDQDLQCYIAPVFSTSMLDPKKPQIQAILGKDIDKALTFASKKFPTYIPPKINYINKLSALNVIKPGDTISFDYETTGLKPHSEGHKIICVSVAISEDEVFVFMMPKNLEKLEPFIKILKNRLIGKIAQNCKFEENWSWVILKTRVKNWIWDTMLASHIIDNRTGITGLKFQVYVRFGVIDYSSEIKKWFTPIESKNGNSLSDIEKHLKIDKNKELLMEYCALDSIFEYRLAKLQQNIINEAELPF